MSKKVVLPTPLIPIIPTVSFLFKINSKSFSIKLSVLGNLKKISINYEFSKNSPYLNIRKLINAIKKHRPRLICLPNPDSPTGQIINNENMQQVLHVAKKNNSLVLIDEAYYLFYKNSFINYEVFIKTFHDHFK
jgi:aspartate/methionine/tyrosine aminotransferase